MEVRTFRIGNGREFYSHVAIAKDSNGVFYGDNFSDVRDGYGGKNSKIMPPDIGKILWEYSGEDIATTKDSDLGIIKGYFIGKGFGDLWHISCVSFR